MGKKPRKRSPSVAPLKQQAAPVKPSTINDLPAPAERLKPLIDREMVSEHLDLMVESALGSLLGGVILIMTILLGGGVDYLEQHITYFHKGPVYDLVKWCIDVVGTLTAGATFIGYQLRTLLKIWETFTRRKRE